MKVMFPSKLFVIAVGLVLSGQVLNAQSIQVLSPVYTRPSPSSANYVTPYTIAAATVSVTCPVGVVPTGTLSGPLMLADGSAPLLSGDGKLQPGGNLLVDNNIVVTVTPFGGPAGTPRNVCAGGANDGSVGPSNPPDLTNNCFNQTYRNNVANITGQNPDTFTYQFAAYTSLTPPVPASYPAAPNAQTPDFFGGVPPADISNDLYPASGQTANIAIALTDEGGSLASSTIFLQTNCTINGVGAGTIGGNPITGTQGSSQTFTFNPDKKGLKGVEFGYDVSNAPSGGKNGAIPTVSDNPIRQSDFQQFYVPKTSFSTANCMVHDGEVLADGVTKACKLYTLLCLDPSNLKGPAGANCPVSNQPNEVIDETFDGPQFNLYDIHARNGGVVHEGIGFLMASEAWSEDVLNSSKTDCTFDSSSGAVAGLPCPQNLLNSFTGPGVFSGTGLTTNPNSEFISIYGVPLDKTLITVAGENSSNWVNKPTQKLAFDVQAPDLTPSPNGAYPYININNVKSKVPGADQYRPQPVKSITYGITSPGSVPNPRDEPISADISKLNPDTVCPSGALDSLTQPDFVTSDNQALSDGKYLVHYYAQDCAGTQELLFTMAPGTTIWATSFYTRPLNVDTKAPAIVGLVVPSPGSFKKNSTVYATYSCTDDPSGAGVVLCGSTTYSSESTYSTGTVKTKLNTSSIGSKSLVIPATDGAGNSSSATITYTVTN
jgi:hypothetical protein